MFKLFVAGFLFLKTGMRGIARNTFLKTATTKAAKFALITFLVCVLILLGIAIWALFTVGHLIQEGEFDTVQLSGNVSLGASGPGAPNVDYDEITDLINRIDLDKIPDDMMITLGKEYLYPTTMPVKTFLKTYLIIAELCKNPMINPDGSITTLEPYMVYGVWMHENHMAIGGEIDPYSAWTTQYGGKAGESNAALFGQLIAPFGEALSSSDRDSGKAGNLSQPVEKIAPWGGSGILAMYISSFENSGLSLGERLVVDINHDILGSHAQKLVFKQHSKLPWTESIPQRPSAFFFPDALATMLYQGRLFFDGQDVYTGADTPMGPMRVINERWSSPGDLRSYMDVAGWFCLRSGRQVWYMSGEDDIGFKVVPYLYELDKAGGKGIDYFCSELFIEEYASGSAMVAFSGEMSALATALVGPEGWQSLSTGGGILPAEWSQEVLAYAGGEAEKYKPYLDGVYVIASGRNIVKSVRDQADALYNNPQYRKDPSDPTYPGNMDYSAGLGVNPFDKRNKEGKNYPDGICDVCGGSIFEEPLNGCTHIPSVKLVWPVRGTAWKFSAVHDFHTATSCPAGVHYNTSGQAYGHEAYDISTTDGGNPDLLATVDGYLLPVSSEGAYGYHTFLVYPNKDTPQFYFSYAHMQSGSTDANLVSGGYISAGDKIGVMGNTGNSKGVHLHFQISATKSTMPVTSYNFMTLNSPIVYGWKEEDGVVRLSPYVENR